MVHKVRFVWCLLHVFLSLNPQSVQLNSDDEKQKHFLILTFSLGLNNHVMVSLLQIVTPSTTFHTSSNSFPRNKVWTYIGYFTFGPFIRQVNCELSTNRQRPVWCALWVWLLTSNSPKTIFKSLLSLSSGTTENFFLGFKPFEQFYQTTGFHWKDTQASRNCMINHLWTYIKFIFSHALLRLALD